MDTTCNNKSYSTNFLNAACLNKTECLIAMSPEYFLNTEVCQKKITSQNLVLIKIQCLSNYNFIFIYFNEFS